MDWQPIDTAPKGPNVLIWDSHREMCALAFFAHGMGIWLDPFECEREFSPTHWIPLPEPPK